MTPSAERGQLVDRIYTRALELGNDEREVYVEAACPDDDIRAEVNALLCAASGESRSFETRLEAIRDKLWADVVSDHESPEEDLTGRSIGNWRIGERLARGGLATVYAAFRDDGEFDQKVAFKVLRRGLDTEDVVARFRAERQILSTLDHPAIARILDGGALPDGRPFLVLEFIDGASITDWCREHDIGVRDRVKLVIDVLQALQHAHSRTVVHRDIKPSNILVSRDGNIALLDFGIAKLLDPDAVPGSSTMTRQGVALLTPRYASPEQRAGQAVTTVSDIYQVGMLLRELLSDAGLDACRNSGDLDAIVSKATHTDPARRYGSASEMIADFGRFLDGKPVLAQPDTFGYRAHRALQRHPWILPVTATFTLGIVAYVVTLTLYSNDVRREQQRAEAAQAFTVDLMSSADPFAPADPERGRNITVVEALRIGSNRLETELSDQPELKAALLLSIARVYSNLDQTAEAIDLGEQALALNRELYGYRSEAVLDNLRLLADRRDAAGDYDQARALFTEQLDIARSLYAEDNPRLGLAEIAIGMFENSQGQHDVGLDLLMTGIDRLRNNPDEYAQSLVTAIAEATAQQGMMDIEASLHLLEEALAIAESSLGPDSVYTAIIRMGIGRDSVYAGDLQRSRENFDQALKILAGQLGTDHSSTISAQNDYAVALTRTGNFREAEAIYRGLVDQVTAINGERHREVATTYQNLATAITNQGRYEDSLPLHRKAHEIYESALTDHYLVAFPLLSIASIEIERGNADEAYAASTEALQRLEATIPGTYLEGVARCLVGLSMEARGETMRGAAMVAESHALIRQQAVLPPRYATLCRL